MFVSFFQDHHLKDFLSLIFVSCLSLFFVLSLSFNGSLYAVIVFGQAHFLISYFYKYKKGGLDNNFLYRFLYLFVILSLLSFFIFKNIDLLNFWMIVTLSIFVVHYFNDEFKLAGLEETRNKIFATASVFFSFLSLFLNKIFHVDIFYSFILSLFSVLFSAYFLKDFNKLNNNKNKYLFSLFYFLNIIIPFILIFNKNVLNHHVASFIIFFHYLRWYLFYAFKFKKSELSSYLNHVLYFNIFVLIIFFLYSEFGFKFLYFMFSPVFFYGWTLLHIFLFIRKSDYSINI